MNRDDAIADIAFLERALEERFSYLKTNGVDHAALFAELREKLPVQVEPTWFGLQLQKLLAHFVDGRSGSSQLVRRESQRWLRAGQMLRSDMGLPQLGEVEVVVASAGGASPRTLSLNLSERPPCVGGLPRRSPGKSPPLPDHLTALVASGAGGGRRVHDELHAGVATAGAAVQRLARHGGADS